MSARIDLSIDDAGEGRFVLHASNGEPVAVGEGYRGDTLPKALDSAKRGAFDMLGAAAELLGAPAAPRGLTERRGPDDANGPTLTLTVDR